MKQPKKPTYEQKKLISKNKLDSRILWIFFLKKNQKYY